MFWLFLVFLLCFLSMMVMNRKHQAGPFRANIQEKYYLKLEETENRYLFQQGQARSNPSSPVERELEE